MVVGLTVAAPRRGWPGWRFSAGTLLYFAAVLVAPERDKPSREIRSHARGEFSFSLVDVEAGLGEPTSSLDWRVDLVGEDGRNCRNLNDDHCLARSTTV